MQILKPKPGYKIVKTKFRGNFEIPNSWELEKFGKTIKMEYGQGLTEKQRSNDGFPVYGSSGIIGHHSKYFVEGPGLILARKGSLGNIFSEKENFWPIDTVYYISKKETKNDLFFLYQLIQYLHLKNYAIVTAHPGISRDEIYTILLKLPSMDEQEKIAFILSNVDSLIQLSKKNVEQTQKLKQGLMQELFIKGIGHNKFKKIKLLPRHIDIKIPTEWKNDKLGNIFIKKPQNGINKKLGEYGNGVPIFEIDSLYRSNFTIEQTNLRHVSVNEEELHTYKLFDDDFVINRVSKVKEGVGKIVLVEKPIKNLIYEGNTIRFSIDSKIVLPRFFKFFSKTRLYFKYIQSTCKTTSLTSIDQDIIKNIPVPIPPIPEQQKIGRTLSNVDSQIEQKKQYHAKLVRIKKALMQKLLTGQIRVKT